MNTRESVEERVASGAASLVARKTAAVLLAFLPDSPELGPTELARRTALNKSTTIRILSSLREFGLVSHDPVTGRYRLGLRILELASALQTHLVLPRIAYPYMVALRDETGESVHLTVPDGHEGVYIEKVDSLGRVHLSTRVGARGPLYAGASMKVILAHLPEETIQSVIRAHVVPGLNTLTRYTPNTVVSIGELLESLRIIREQGYAHSEGELNFGFSAVAAPIWKSDGTVAGGLSVVAPSVRFTQEVVRGLVPKVVRRAQEISMALGWAGDAGEGRPS
ncbi:MAG TPA: IclR family transcriptional regulator [Firmicutes bacterium]|nr:IclR family transcriptional regulator [Bacillota bacterium]